MNRFSWLTDLSGRKRRIADLEAQVDRLQNEQQLLLNDIRAQLKHISGRLDVIGPGLGRVIAKLDAKFTETEFSAERKAESDKIGEEALRRLRAEAAARAPYNE